MEPLAIEELGISPYKQKLLRMRLDGFLPKQIAHLENRAHGTIDNHFQQIFHKHETSSLLDFLIKVGWVRVISKQT
jgi:DNA-binding NarL/FixJ family response regulator